MLIFSSWYDKSNEIQISSSSISCLDRFRQKLWGSKFAWKNSLRKICSLVKNDEKNTFKAIDSMHGYGYDHLILSVEWSENRKKEESTEKPAGYQSRVRR